jgi:NRAMP (natural resistance-associated macrophage protein)-like metal ion transporter
MAKKHTSKAKKKSDTIKPEMVVEATKGDLGEEDVSKPKVADVIQDEQGDVEKVVVEKGVFFKKKLEIPADRVQDVEQMPKDEKTAGKVTVDVGEKELEDLKPVGVDELAPEKEHDPLDEVERKIPTAEGLRELEAIHVQEQMERAEPQSLGDQATKDLNIQNQAEHRQQPATQSKLKQVLRTIGPGFLSGMAGNDATAVTAYAINGATAGYSQLWLMLLSTPMYQAVQFSCAKIGRLTQKGFSEILREYYGGWIAIFISLVLIVANIALLAGDLVAIGSGCELITGISWVWFVIPVGAILWYLTVFRSFETLKKIFIVLSLTFVAYVITALFSHANWAAILISTFVPRLSFDFGTVSVALALLGATITPYSMVWQVQAEKEQKRTGSTQQQLRSAVIDVASGVIGGNLVSYFIIVTTASTLFTHHQSINTAADAAAALQPLLGPLAKYLFAVGLIGAGVVAIPIILASTSFAVAGAFGWPAGLSKKPWQNEGFYLIMTFALVVSLVVALLRVNPIQLIFWANILVGVLAPILVIFIIMVGNNRRIMKNQRLGGLTNVFLAATVVVLITTSLLFFYGLVTGRGS